MYGQNWKIEPYINLRKKPTLKTIESLLGLLEARTKHLSENDKTVINLLKRFVAKEVFFDKI
ncbi:hypothetical protein HZA71_01740, partial [Candidatus Falkowbacteria bacterium]|nr:hypothetical protein [Candidatus Falkowbacteria bacterium]